MGNRSARHLHRTTGTDIDIATVKGEECPVTFNKTVVIPHMLQQFTESGSISQIDAAAFRLQTIAGIDIGRTATGIDRRAIGYLNITAGTYANITRSGTDHRIRA